MKKHNFKYYLAASVSLISFLVYLSSLQNEFVEWDDRQYVFENPHIRSFDLTFFKWAFLDFYAANWHPLTWISHALDYAVWGLNPLGHHLTNNMLHAANTFLVVVLVVKLLETARSGDKPPLPLLNQGGELLYESSPPILGGVAKGRGGKWLHDREILIAAATTGLLFGLHPLHVESVAWVAERKDLLCALFYLLSVMAYTGYAGPKEGQPQRVAPTRTYFLSLCFFALALLSKPMAVSLPLVLLILDWYPFNRIQSLKTFWPAFLEKTPFIALGLVSSVLTVLAQKTGEAIRSIEAIPLSSRILVAAESLIVYLGKMILPLDLIPFYPYPKNPSLFSLEYLSAITLATGITAACLILAKNQKLLSSVWAYYVLTLVPVLGLVQVGSQSMADRYTYLPSLGPFLLIGLTGAWISTKGHSPGKWDKIFKAAPAIFVLVWMTFLTVNQISIWKDSIDLWSYVIEKQPTGVPIAYNNRGIAYVGMGRLDKALTDLDKAIALDPSYHTAYNNRGVVFSKLGRLEGAIADYDKAIALKPGYSEAYNNRGSALEKIGQLAKAIIDYDRAIALNPRYSEAYVNRGIALGKTSLFDKSIESLSKALEIDPNNADAYVSRGLSYALINRNDMAIEDFNTAIRFNPNHILAYFNRGDLHLRKGNKGLAILDFQKACDLGDKEGCEALEALIAIDK